MDALSFLASLVESLAWPVTVIAVILLLRSEIVSLLPFLRRLKAGPVEAEFEREVQELKAESPKALDAPTSKALESKTGHLLHLASVSPRAAILEAWQGVEFAVRRAALQTAGSPVPDVTSPLRALREVTQLELLSADEIALFHDLRGLRNQAIHAPDFIPSYESVANYVQLAQALQARLERIAGNGS